jgi:hypothetical protein
VSAISHAGGFVEQIQTAVPGRHVASGQRHDQANPRAKAPELVGSSNETGSRGALFVHIGLYKTGTTSLQTFLIRNAQALSAAGVWYPLIGRQGGPSHLNLKLELGSESRFDSALGTWDDVIAGVPDLRKTVVSSEDLGLVPRDKVELLAKRLRGIDTWILVYLKRQDALVQSWYSQMCKDGRTSLTFNEFLEAREGDRTYRFYDLLQPWADGFGADRIKVRPLENGQLAGGNLFSDFLAAIDAPANMVDRLTTVPSLNRSLSPRGLAVVRSIHQLRLSAGVFDQKEFARWVGGPVAQADALTYPQPKRGSLMSGADADKFLSYFAEQNARVARTYLGRSDGVLFTESPDISREATSIDVENLGVDELLQLLDRVLTPK